MSHLILTDARVRALKARKSTYHVRDSKLRGFGVRVLPSGAKRFFLHSQHRGQRSWNIVGDANALPVTEARSRALLMLARLRGDAPVDVPPFEAVAEAVFRRYARVWKPRTLYVNRSYYRSTLAPWFAGRPISDINRQEVERWFASLRATPVSADRSMPVLSVILTEAERMGHRPEGSNPCRGIRRYRRKGPWVFPARRGSGPAKPEWLRHFWHRVREEAELPDVRLHDLRHAHASFALRQGESVLAIARLLGHRAPTTTLKYTHSAEAMVREAAERVGEALGG